jgi:hypothetical protein
MHHAGGCHCGAIRYELATEPKDVSLCHCSDCRRSAGAPVVAWAGFAESDLTLVRGTPKTINSSGAAMRSFCADCGTGLFYRNAQMLPASSSFKWPRSTIPRPARRRCTSRRRAARLDEDRHELPRVDRFPE